MKKSTGYKEMLRDRCPKVVDFALKWCQAKERWIDHAYANFIKIYVSNNERKHATRITLGIAKYYRDFIFDKSINWEDLTHEEETYWRYVSGWVRWFTERFAYIENTYNISRSVGKSQFDCKVEIIQKFLSSELPSEDDDDETKEKKYAYVNKLTDYLVRCIENIKKQ